MSDLVQNVINQALQDGARPAKFKCQVVFPSIFQDENTQQDNLLDAMCKNAQFGNKFNEAIMVKHKGRDIPVPGQEKFTHVVAITLYLEESHSTKNLFYKWMQGLNYDTYQEKAKNNAKVQDMQEAAVSAMYGQLIVTQLDFDNDKELVKYTFHNIFPKELDAITLDSSSVSSISEYACTFSYSHYEIEELSETNSNDVANAILDEVQGAVNDVVNKAIGFIPGLDTLESAAKGANQDIKKLGKSIGSSWDEFLG